jgi:hypothetical protein
MALQVESGGSENALLLFSALKTCDDIWKGRDQVVSIQLSMSGEGHWWSPGQVRAVPEPGVVNLHTPVAE